MWWNFNKVIHINIYSVIQDNQCWNIGLNRPKIAHTIGNGLVTIKLVRKDILHLIVWPIDQKFIFQYSQWRPSWQLAWKSTLIDTQRVLNPVEGFIYVPIFSLADSESYFYATSGIYMYLEEAALFAATVI